MPVFDGVGELQAGITRTLLGDEAISSLIGVRVYDQMPTSGSYPCIAFGPSDGVDGDSDCISAEEVTLQIDVWSQDQGQLGPCRDLTAVVRRALHQRPLSLTAPFAASTMRVARMRVVRDGDGSTAHGIITVRVRLQEVASDG